MKEESKTNTVSANPGGSELRPDEPIFQVVPGYDPYLWVGNNSPKSMACFATIGGAKLRLLYRLLGIALRKSKHARPGRRG